MINDAIRFFLDRYGLTLANIDSLLAGALSRGGDYADLYLEYRLSNSLGLAWRNRFSNRPPGQFTRGWEYA